MLLKATKNKHYTLVYVFRKSYHRCIGTLYSILYKALCVQCIRCSQFVFVLLKTSKDVEARVAYFQIL